MMRFLTLALLASFMFACQPKENATENTATEPQQEAVEAAPVTDGVFIHISHGKDDPHRLLMALSMANKMAADKDVLVYMDIEAVHTVVKDAEAIEMEPFGNHIDLLTFLYDMGVEVFACPGCMEVAGYTADDLREGVQVASKEKFFNFTEGRILSLDY